MTPTQVRERPILFSPPMVLGILENRKFQTRRIVKPQPKDDRVNHWVPITEQVAWRTWEKTGAWHCGYCRPMPDGSPSSHFEITGSARCTYGNPGDLIWVREGLHRPDGDPWLYRADNMPVMVDKADESAMVVWAHHKQQDYCPSMFMPRWASRITLELTEVRVEKLQEISREDAIAEGIQVLPLQSADDPSAWFQSAPGVHQERTPQASYAALWDSINGKKHPWKSSPWVWVLAFRRVEQNGGAV